MATKPKKGVAGKKTGAKTRKAIASARKKGASATSIAKAAMRDPKTIALIEKGGVKNPPSNLAGKIRKAKKDSSGPTTKSKVNVKAFNKAKRKHAEKS
jgi:hypothetical protein